MLAVSQFLVSAMKNRSGQSASAHRNLLEILEINQESTYQAARGGEGECSGRAAKLCLYLSKVHKHYCILNMQLEAEHAS